MRANATDHAPTRRDSPAVPEYVIRRARTADVPAIRRLVDTYSANRILLSKEMVTLYEDVQEFWVAADTQNGGLVGCGALHVIWEDLAESTRSPQTPRAQVVESEPPCSAGCWR